MSASVAAPERPVRDRRRSAAATRQMRAERALVAAHMGRFEPLLVVESLASVGGWALAGAAGVLGWVPWWVSLPIASLCAFVAYMPLHEASHNNIQGRRRELRFVNEAVGHLSAIPLLMDHFSHRSSHMKHHAFTNDAARDTDMIYAGPLWKAALVGALSPVILLLVLGVAAWLPPLRKRLLAQLEPGASSRAEAERELAISRRFTGAAVLLVAGLAYAGFALEVLLVWIAPATIGTMLLVVVFAWLPHHPHNAYGRYTNTRATLYPGSGLIALGHDRHIIHHMIPRIPHHRLGRAFDALRPTLEERGTRIEGSRAGAGAPRVFMGADPDAVQAIGEEAARLDARPFE